MRHSDLFGRIDIVPVKYKIVIFVHGCFWHMHNCRYGKVIPATNREFWQTKRRGNVLRDAKNIKELKNAGWKVLTIWECQTKDITKLLPKLQNFLSR